MSLITWAKGGVRGGELFLMFWICSSIDWCVRVTWECNDAKVAQSCLMDSMSC